MDLNRLDFPRLAHYLDALPNRLNSHPTATTKAAFSQILRRHLEPILQSDRLPPDLIAPLTAAWGPSAWIPTTHYVSLCEIARDQLWQTDAAYEQGMFGIATEMYSGPGYRALFFMFGPSVLAMSSAKRWDTVHQGTQLMIKEQKKASITLVLTFPENLFSETSMQSLGAAFCAIAQGSRAKAPKVNQARREPTEAEMTISWEY